MDYVSESKESDKHVKTSGLSSSQNVLDAMSCVL